MKYLVGLVLLGLIGASLDLGAIGNQLRILSATDIALICLASLALLACQALRFHALVLPYVPKFRVTLRLSLVSVFFSNFLPGGMGGDIYKVTFLRQQKVSTTDVLVFIALDRIVALFLFFAASAILFLAKPAYFAFIPISPALVKSKTFPFVILLLAAAIFGIVIFKTAMKNFCRQAKETLVTLSQRQLLLFAAFSLLTFFVRIGMTYLIIWSFVPDFRWEYIIVLLFIIHFVAMVPVSIGSLGVMEGSMIVALSLLGVSTESGASIAIVYRLTIIFLSICGLLAWLAYKNEKPQERTAAG